MKDIRNVAIIAHVDHGKTTLVDALLRQSKTKLSKAIEEDRADLIMDSNDLERERGITIFSKNASIEWHDTKINIIDTPGHADFGGEVERVLSMADGALLLIDAKEGPMPQTRFVLKKALERKLKVIVVVNKIDKQDARIHHVLDKTFELFIELGADEATAYFPTIYASAKNGLAGLDSNIDLMTDITPIFDVILKEIPAPSVDIAKPLQMSITTLSSDSFRGRIATGRIYNGTIRANSDVVHINRAGESKKARIVNLMTFVGLERTDIDEAVAGDIVAIAGIPDVTIGETIADPLNPIALPVLSIEEPTVKMQFSVNTSPFAGQEGEFKTSRQIRDRLFKELETDMALRVEDNPDGTWTVSGRGELHLAILIERMRRQGYEFQVARPHVILKEENGKKLAPYERIYIEVPEDLSGVVMQKLGMRKAVMQDMTTDNGISYIEFVMPTRNLFGYRSEFITDTRGLGIIAVAFDHYGEDQEGVASRSVGSLVAHETGTTTGYGLTNIQDRGILFIGPAVQVYKGQVVGQNSREDDIDVNVCKTKNLTNMRSKGEGTNVHVNTPKIMSLEDALEYISDDELVEITPKTIRIRKKILDQAAERRKRAQGM